MNSRLRPILACTLFSAAVLSVGGCKKTEIRSYIAPKDVAAAETPAAPAAATAAKEKPQLEFMLPPGWEETPANSVSLASFKIKKGDAEASVNITPLPNLKGRESMVVNMWRDQAGLPPIDDAELAKTLQPVQVGDDQGQMFEVLGSKDGGKPLRIVTAFVHKPDASWFYKLAGEEALVTETKPVFVEFLKTVHSHETPAAPETTSAPPAPVAPAPGASKWNGPVPEG